VAAARSNDGSASCRIIDSDLTAMPDDAPGCRRPAGGAVLVGKNASNAFAWMAAASRADR
jgi:hypothetical protein